jgi:hypothetical protein
VDMQRALIFQNLFQFCGRQRSSHRFMRMGHIPKDHEGSGRAVAPALGRKL